MLIASDKVLTISCHSYNQVTATGFNWQVSEGYHYARRASFRPYPVTFISCQVSGRSLKSQSLGEGATMMPVGTGFRPGWLAAGDILSQLPSCNWEEVESNEAHC